MLDRTERIRLAGHVGCDPRTVSAWLEDPESVKRYLADALAAAAVKLKIDLPKEATGTEG